MWKRYCFSSYQLGRFCLHVLVLASKLILTYIYTSPPILGLSFGLLHIPSLFEYLRVYFHGIFRKGELGFRVVAKAKKWQSREVRTDCSAHITVLLTRDNSPHAWCKPDLHGKKACYRQDKEFYRHISYHRQLFQQWPQTSMENFRFLYKLLPYSICSSCSVFLSRLFSPLSHFWCYGIKFPSLTT